MSTVADPAAFDDLWGEESGSGRQPLTNVLRLGLALFAVLFLLALVVPIGGAVLGTGEVGVESRVKRVAHPTGGVIETIAVSNGQHVVAGQLLVRLESTVARAAADYSSMTVEQLLAQRARLEAERLGRGNIIFPAQLTAARTDNARQAMTEEAALFRLRQGEIGQLTAQLRARIEQQNQQIASYAAQIASFERQRELIQPELEGVRSLWERRLVTINRLNELERTAESLDGSIASTQAQIAQARARITETQEQIIQIGQSRRAEAATQLATINTALNEQQMQRVSATDQNNNREIRAPYSGTVEKLAFAAVGDVIQAAQPIMEIVPDSDAMIVEAFIAPRDIDQVRRGQRARLRFTAFNNTASPQIDGQVTYVATDRQTDETTGAAYYLARIALDQRQVAAEGLDLRSGMPVEVHIATGSRSLISFLTKPLRDQFARAFRAD